MGFFCSACAERKALKATALTWFLGWWGFPWGPVYSLQSIFTNMFGGKKPVEVNAELLAHQAWAFALSGKSDIARCIALDALSYAKKIKLIRMSRRDQKAGVADPNIDTRALRASIEKLLTLLDHSPRAKLKNSWAIMRRPFFAQATTAIALFGALGFALFSGPSSSEYRYSESHTTSETLSSYKPDPYSSIVAPEGSLRSPDVKAPDFVRPLTAPNGEPWPSYSGYILGFEKLATDGLSQVTIDNTRNDSDMFVKLVALDGSGPQPVRTILVKAFDSFTINEIAIGNYDVRYRNLSDGSLIRSESFQLEERTFCSPSASVRQIGEFA